MTIDTVFASALHVLVSLLLLLVPLYVDHLERSWNERLFAPHSLKESAQTLGRYLKNIHAEVRKSIARISLTVSGFLALLVILFPSSIVECVCVLALVSYALYRKYDNMRRCPSCFSFVHDSIKTCPECGQHIGLSWGIVSQRIKANWLTVNNRFFRYKCS